MVELERTVNAPHVICTEQAFFVFYCHCHDEFSKAQFLFLSQQISRSEHSINLFHMKRSSRFFVENFRMDSFAALILFLEVMFALAPYLLRDTFK